jgi:hypothetical protein
MIDNVELTLEPNSFNAQHMHCYIIPGEYPIAASIARWTARFAGLIRSGGASTRGRRTQPRHLLIGVRAANDEEAFVRCYLFISWGWMLVWCMRSRAPVRYTRYVRGEETQPACQQWTATISSPVLAMSQWHDHKRRDVALGTQRVE